jgi:hypothetical protein
MIYLRDLLVVFGVDDLEGALTHHLEVGGDLTHTILAEQGLHFSVLVGLSVAIGSIQPFSVDKFANAVNNGVVCCATIVPINEVLEVVVAIAIGNPFLASLLLDNGGGV